MKTEKNANLLFLATFLFLLGDHQCRSNSTADEEALKELLYLELSADTYFSLPFHDPGDSAETFRRQYATGEVPKYSQEEENWAQKHNPPSLQGQGMVVDRDFLYAWQENKAWATLNPHAVTIFHLCYCVSYIWRRGKKGIHKYYPLRDTYYNHMPFEIGYITQTIMAKYQNVLELYEFVTRKEPGRYIGRPHLLFFYKNIMEDCRTIIHLCNMIHEVTRKYMLQQNSNFTKAWSSVYYDASAKFQDPVVRNWYRYDNNLKRVRGVERGIEGLEHEKHVHEDKAMFNRIKEAGSLVEKERERQAQINRVQKYYFMDHAEFMSTSATSRRTKRWRSNEPIIYGWEPEDKPE